MAIVTSTAAPKPTSRSNANVVSQTDAATISQDAKVTANAIEASLGLRNPPRPDDVVGCSIDVGYGDRRQAREGAEQPGDGTRVVPSDDENQSEHRRSDDRREDRCVTHPRHLWKERQ